jgi:transcription initiation factor TFIID subunit 5
MRSIAGGRAATSQLASPTPHPPLVAAATPSCRRVALLEGHEGPVWSLSYSRGTGCLLASGGADNTVRLWSAPKAGNSMVSLVAEAKAAAQVGSSAAGRPSEDGGGGGGGGAAGGGAAAAAGAAAAKPYQQLRAYRTRATPVAHVAFTPRNLLLAGGAWAPRPVRKP